MQEKDDETFYSLAEAAKAHNLVRQAIFLAIKKGKLAAIKRYNGNQAYYVIRKKDLEDYLASKYNPEKRTFEGEKILDPEKDQWSVEQAAKTLTKMLGRPIPTSHIYYLLRTGQLYGKKKGGLWVLSKAKLLERFAAELDMLVGSRQSI